MAYPHSLFINFTEVNLLTDQKKINRKIWSSLLFFGLCLLVAFGARALYTMWEDSKVDTDTLFYDALADINEWNSYRYTLDARLLLNNYKTAETVISGEVDTEGNLHVFGEIMDTEMEAFQFGDTHYRFNSAAKKWVLLENSPLTTNAVLLMEIEPVLNFAFTETISVTYEGKKSAGGDRLFQYTIVPKEGFHIADAYFSDFTYEVGINGRTGQIEEAVINAVSRTDEQNRLEVIVNFYDINEDFVLTPPAN